MVKDILQWAYQKYRVYCFIAFILLALCLLGYIALIGYWFHNMKQTLKVRKKHPPLPQPEQLTALPASTSEPVPDENITLDEPPISKIRVHKGKHPSTRLKKAKRASMTPSPPHQRVPPRWLGHGLRLKSSTLDAAATPQKGVSHRLKDDQPAKKQFLFV